MNQPSNTYQELERLAASLALDAAKREQLCRPARQLIKDGRLLRTYHRQSFDDFKEQFHRSFAKVETGCWEWVGRMHEKGYGVIPYRGHEARAHRASYVIFNGYIELGMDICHRCDNRKCVNPDHLFQGTRQDNVTDMVKKGRRTWRNGEAVALSKLKELQVVEMRNRFAEGVATYRSIASEYGVTECTAYNAINGKTWKHIPIPTRMGLAIGHHPAAYHAH